jgi:hypothetical protein
MADIRVERGGRRLTWLWVLIAVIVVIAAVVLLLDYAGYIDLGIRLGAQSSPHSSLAQAAPVNLQEV